MNPEQTIPISWDYLVELSDDGKQPDAQETEVIIIPPVPDATDAKRTSTTAAPGKEPES